MGESGRVVGVEHIPDLVTRSVSAIRLSSAAALLEGGQLSIHLADGREGYAEVGPYDAIHVGAAAPGGLEEKARGKKKQLPVVVRNKSHCRN